MQQRSGLQRLWKFGMPSGLGVVQQLIKEAQAVELFGDRVGHGFCG